jgi:hypothetical protein
MGNSIEGGMSDKEFMPTPETKDGPLEKLRALIKGKLATPEDDKDVVVKSAE